MKLQILSDMHFEFGEYDLDFSNTDLVVIAGDLNIGENGFNWIAKNIKDLPVIYILGNHEYYRNSYPKLLHKLKEKSKPTNIRILENESVTIDGITFHGATLWTSFELLGDPKVAGFECQQRMTDYKLIRISPTYSKLRSLDTHLMHHNSLKWLTDSLENSLTSKNIVITHHAPSKNSIPDYFKNDIFSSAYASNLDDFILKHQPDIWIHGHIHHSFDYHIGKTRIICNPKGYPDEKNNGFNPKLTIEV